MDSSWLNFYLAVCCFFNPSLSLSHTLSRSLSHNLTLSNTHTDSNSRNLTHTHTLALSYMRIHPHTLLHSLTHSGLRALYSEWSSTLVPRSRLALITSESLTESRKLGQLNHTSASCWASAYRVGDHLNSTHQTNCFSSQEWAPNRSEGKGLQLLVIEAKDKGKVEEQQGRLGGKGSSPTLLSHLNPEPGPAPSLSIVDGSGSESVKSLRRRETHIHLN